MKKTWIRNVVISSLVLLALGLLMIFATETLLVVFVRVIGVVTLVGAVFGFVLQLVSAKEARSALAMAVACLSAVFGAVLIACPLKIAGLLPYVFGVVLILLSVKELFVVTTMQTGRIFSIILASLGIILGTVIVCNPVAIAEFITKIIGAGLIYLAAVGLVDAILLERGAKT